MVKIRWDGVEWGGPFSNWYYLYWWNWLSKDSRYWGKKNFWYDGPHYSFGLWYTNITWVFPWSKYRKEDF